MKIEKKALCKPKEFKPYRLEINVETQEDHDKLSSDLLEAAAAMHHVKCSNIYTRDFGGNETIEELLKAKRSKAR